LRKNGKKESLCRVDDVIGRRAAFALRQEVWLRE
jgi:hypothetical protein